MYHIRPRTGDRRHEEVVAKEDAPEIALSHLGISPARGNEIMDRVADAVLGTGAAVMAHMQDYPAFKEVGSRMLGEWEAAVDSFMS